MADYNLKIIDNKVIFDGHAENSSDCHTLTLLCNLLQKNTKTVDYRTGYAEFELEDIPSENRFWFTDTQTFYINDILVQVDAGQAPLDAFSGSLSIDLSFSQDGVTVHNTGSLPCKVRLSSDLDLNSYFSITSIPSIAPGGTALLPFLDNIKLRSILSYDGQEISEGDVISDNGTKLTVSKIKSVDLATLPGWSSLSGGPHNITIVAKAAGYADSEESTGVEVTRGAWAISDNINPRATRLVLGVYNVVNGEIGTLAKSYTMDIQPGMIVPIPDTRAMTGGVKFIGWLDDGTFNASDLSAITYGAGINPLSDRYGAVWQSATYASKDDVPPSMVIDETTKAFATVKFNFASVPEGAAKIKISTRGYPSVYNATTMKVASTASYSGTTVELASWTTTLFAE